MLAYRYEAFLVSFAHHLEHAILQPDIGQSQATQLRDSKPSIKQCEDNGVIPIALGRRSIYDS